jgi:PAS domain S-box-containing protein
MFTDETPQWIVDAATLTVIDANEAAAEMWGYPMDELIGLDVLKFVPVEDQFLVHKAARENQWGDAGIWRCQKKDGTIFHIRIRWHQFMYNDRLCDFVFAQPESDDAVIL